MNNSELKDLCFQIEHGQISASEVVDQIHYMNDKKEIIDKYQGKIKERSDGRAYIYVNRKQITAPNTEELYSKLYKLEYGIETYTMADIFPLWMRWKRDNTAACGRTLRIITQEWNKYFIGQEILNKPLIELTGKDFTKLFRVWTCKRQLTAKMFNNLKSICNGIYSYSISELEIVNYNPIKGIDMKQFPTKPQADNDDNVFTEEDRNAILAHIKGDDDMYAIAISLDFQVTLRFAELSALKKTDYFNGKLRIRSQHLLDVEMNDDLSFTANRFINADHIKGNTSDGYRYIPLNDTAKGIVERAIELNPDSEYLFMFEGKQLSISTFNARLRRYCKEIGIQPKSSHKIRFCVASILYQNGMPLTELKRMLGHSTVQMTLHYLRNVSANSNTLDIMQKCL